MRAIAADPADAYASEFLLNPLAHALGVEGDVKTIYEELLDPAQSLCGIFARILFCRRGKERFEIADAACDALDDILEAKRHFMREEGAEELWNRYCDLMKERGKRPQEQLERGPIQGVAEWAQELVRNENRSVCGWIVRSIRRTGRVEEIVDRILDIRGVGPKVCAVLLRDFVFISDSEDRVNYADRRYLQPIDKWVRLGVPYFVPDLDESDAADWILAGKISKHARLAEVSGIRLNMGMTYMGLRSGSPDSYARQLRKMRSLAEAVHGNPKAVQGESGLESLDGLTEAMEHGA